MPKVSAIVPVYNSEKYIHECVNSILSQSFRDLELILVDDGSGAVLEEYATADGRRALLEIMRLSCQMKCHSW